MFKRWNMILIILTYSLVIFGTFLTRSGVLSSVHAFAQSAIGPLFFTFIGVTFIVSLGLLLHRWNSLRSEGQMNSVFSRESLFLINNLLFMGILLVCFWGVIYPLVRELFTGEKVTVSAPYYESAAGPLFAALLLLMGIAPLSAWSASTYRSLGRAVWKPALVSLAAPVIALILGVRNAWAIVAIWLVGFVIAVTIYDYAKAVISRTRRTGENIPMAFWRLGGKNRRRYGGYIIHLGIVLMAFGIIGIEMFQQQTQATLKIGQNLQLAGYTVTFDDLKEYMLSDAQLVGQAEMSVERNGRPLGTIQPRVDFFFDAQQTMTIPGIRSTLEDDLYVILVDWEAISTAGATFKVYHNPLVNWMWIGAGVLIIGMLVAAWPTREDETIAERTAIRSSNPRTTEEVLQAQL